MVLLREEESIKLVPQELDLKGVAVDLWGPDIVTLNKSSRGRLELVYWLPRTLLPVPPPPFFFLTHPVRPRYECDDHFLSILKRQITIVVGKSLEVLHSMPLTATCESPADFCTFLRDQLFF